MKKANQINVPKEHPILRNIFMCIFCLLVVAPILINLIDKAFDFRQSQQAVKSEETVGQILEYTLITDSEGETVNFNTTIEYTLDGYTYSKIFKTRYYIAEKGEFVKMYYEKGNPYSADVVKESDLFDLEQKMNVYSMLCMIMVLLFSINAYNDSVKARERQVMLAQNQYMIQNGVIPNNMGTSIQTINQGVSPGMNPNLRGLSNINNTTPKW